MENAITSHENEPGDPNAPDFIAWHVPGGGKRSRGKSRWTRIGAAWKHHDGKGINIQLDLIPTTGGRIILRCPKSADACEGQQLPLLC